MNKQSHVWFFVLSLASAALLLLPPPARAQGVVSSEVIEQIRQELERTHREAEEYRRQSEQRIQALEQKLEQLEQRAPADVPPDRNVVTTQKAIRANVYGFVRADLDHDSNALAFGPHLPFYALSSADPRRARGDSDFSIHPRLTRLGIDVAAAESVDLLGGVRASSKVETDFFNYVPGLTSATSNSRQFLRIRHAYVRLDDLEGDWHLLAGQTWDLVSPLFPTANDDVLMWMSGNLGDRRPQLRFAWTPPVNDGRATVAVALGAPTAVAS